MEFKLIIVLELLGSTINQFSQSTPCYTLMMPMTFLGAPLNIDNWVPPIGNPMHILT